MHEIMCALMNEWWKEGKEGKSFVDKSYTKKDFVARRIMMIMMNE